jgi:DNA-binding transcriptional regulator YdaS (Cro superfamily)
MTLDEYIKANDMRMQDMANELGIAYMYLSSIRRRFRRPSRELANKIELMTGGQVTAEELRRRNEKNGDK